MNEKFFDLKREKQDRMLNAAFKVFARNGYRHASTDDIVKEAGISKGLLFHYFNSKVGLYVFLMDYSVRFLTMEISRAVKKEETEFWEICKQIEYGKLQVLKNYPYMSAFLDRAFVENCLEALEECEEQKRVYCTRIEEYFSQAAEDSFGKGQNRKQMEKLMEYIRKGIVEENIALDTFQPEMMYGQVCEYLELMKGVCNA